jgi:hypothetical protein
MVGVQVFGVDRVVKKLVKFGHDVDAANRKVAVDGSLTVRNMLVARMSAPKRHDPFWGEQSPLGDFLARRTGAAVETLSPGGVRAAYKVDRTWYAAVGSPLPYVLLHEEGGLTGPAAIPTGAAQRRGGSGNLMFPGGPKDYPGAFHWPSKKMRESENPEVRSKYGPMGHWLAWTKSGALELLFLFKQSTTQRGRHLFGHVRAEVQPILAEMGSLRVQIATGEANA